MLLTSSFIIGALVFLGYASVMRSRNSGLRLKAAAKAILSGN